MAARGMSARLDCQTQTQQREQRAKASSQSPQLNITRHCRKPLIGKQQSHFRVAIKLILASSSAPMASARVTLGKSSKNSLSLLSCSRQSVSAFKPTRL